MNNLVEDEAVNNLSRKETIRIMDFFLHKQCDLGRMKNTPYDNPELIWNAVNKVFEEWKQFSKEPGEEGISEYTGVNIFDV